MYNYLYTIILFHTIDRVGSSHFKAIAAQWTSDIVISDRFRSVKPDQTGAFEEMDSWVALFQIFIELDDGKIYRKALYLMVKTMVSCKFSLKPIHWNIGLSWSILTFGKAARSRKMWNPICSPLLNCHNLEGSPPHFWTQWPTHCFGAGDHKTSWELPSSGFLGEEWETYLESDVSRYSR